MEIIFTNAGEPLCGSNKELFQKMPIYRASEKFLSLQILHHIGVVREYIINFEGPDIEGFKFTMLAFVLLQCIPF